VELLATSALCWADPPPASRELWVEVSINKVPLPDFALVNVDAQGGLYARKSDLTAWHLRLPQDSTAAGASETLIRVDNLPGLHTHIDPRLVRLEIDAEPSSFIAQVYDGQRRAVTPDRGMAASFLSYDLFAQRDSGGIQNYSGRIEFGGSLGRASLTNSWLADHMSVPEAVSSGSPPTTTWTRLDSALLLDWPELTARLTVGDSITPGGTLGHSVRFTGAHWATDYATQPTLVPYALPYATGTSTVPSSVDLYVNQSLVGSNRLGPGPFELRNLPVPVGSGDVEIRMRDLLGRDRLISVPYLVTPELLAPGVMSSDFAVGAVRRNYGRASYDYGSPFLSVGFVRGQSDRITVNSSVEVQPDEWTLRGGGAMRLARNVTVDITPAVSHSDQGTGTGIDAGIDSVHTLVNLGLRLRAASHSFIELGSDGLRAPLHTEWSARASTRASRMGSLGLVYARRTSFGAPAASATTLSYNLGLRQIGALSLFVSRTQGTSGDVVAGLTFSRYLGRNLSAFASVTSDNGSITTEERISATAPLASGWGWDAARSQGATESAGLRVQARSSLGVGTGEFDLIQGAHRAMLGWQGGLLWTGGRPWLGQTLSGPAALVDLPGLPAVRVMHDGQPAGRTDDQGRILVEGLRPFEDNVITLALEDLPLTALVSGESRVVRPYSHGVERIDFNVAALDSEMITLRTDQGEPVPAGALILIGDQVFLVGKQGRAQIPVLKAAATDALVKSPEGQCVARLPASRRSARSRVIRCVGTK
jgi:outer membrane usher protein